MKHPPSIRRVYYFEIIKIGAKVQQWSVVIRSLSAANQVDPEGRLWEYQGPYTRDEAEPIFCLMAGKFGDPVRRAW